MMKNYSVTDITDYYNPDMSGSNVQEPHASLRRVATLDARIHEHDVRGTVEFPQSQFSTSLVC